MRIELVNSGAAVRGMLEVVEARGGPTRGMAPYAFVQQRDVFLSAHARKVLSVTVDPDTVAQPLVLRFTGAGQRHETAVTLRGRFTGQPLVLLLTRSHAAPALPLPYETPVPVVSLPLSDLPEDARAYGGVWSVMLYEQSLRGMSRRQRAALEHWLASGGTLAVLGGVHFALYRDRATAPLLPVAVRGVKRMAALPELSARFGGGLADLLVQDAAAHAGSTVLLEERGAPILVQRDHGAGRVVYLALDVGRPPASDWAGLPALFGEMLGTPPSRGADPWSAWNREVFTALLQDFGFSGLRSPAPALLLALALYIGALLLWFRRWKRAASGRRLALAPAGLVAVAALGGYGYFDRGAHVPDGILISSTVVDGSPWSGAAPAHANVGLFATRRKHFSFSLRDGWNQFDLVPAADAAASLVLRQARPHARVHVPLTEWTSALFRLRSLEPSPVGIDWQHTADTYRIAVANRGVSAFTDCWLVVGGRWHRLGDVPPGGTLRRELAVPPREGEGQGGGRRQPRGASFDDDARALLLRDSVFPDGAADDPGAAFVIGWIGGAEPALQVDDPRVSAHHFRLFRVALPLGAAEEDP